MTIYYLFEDDGEAVLSRLKPSDRDYITIKVRGKYEADRYMEGFMEVFYDEMCEDDLQQMIQIGLN